MKNKSLINTILLRDPVFLLTFFSLSLVSISVHAGVYADCDGSICVNKTINANSEGYIDQNSLQFKGDTELNILAPKAFNKIGGKYSLNDKTQLNINAKDSISAGALSFYQTAQMNVNVKNGLSGLNTAHKEIFNSGTRMNIKASEGLSGGNQIFKNAILAINAENGISGGYQILDGSSQLDINADNAILGGMLKLQNEAVINAKKNNAIQGGTQNFIQSSKLNASGTNTLKGGTQNFQDNSIFNANGEGSITGKSTQTFSKQSMMNVNSINAINGGKKTTFKDNAVLNINAAKGISGGELWLDGNSILNINADNAIVSPPHNNVKFRFKGNSQINLNHEKSLANILIKLEGNSGITLNNDNALDHTVNLFFSKTYDTTTGSFLDLNGHTTDIGTISGNDTLAVIKNSDTHDAALMGGLYSYQVSAGKSYQYPELLQTGIMRSDAIVSSAVPDIIRQTGLVMLPQYSDRMVTTSGTIIQTGSSIWVKALYDKQQNSGDGIAHPSYQSNASGIQIGVDLLPINDNTPSKIGIYFGYLNNSASISGKTFYADNAQLGKVELGAISSGIYWRYLATQGWYTNTTLQLNHYRGSVEANNSNKKPNFTANGYLIGLETGYPIAFQDSFTITPSLQVTYQSLKLSDYKFSNLLVDNNSDEQMTIQAGARIHKHYMSVAGTEYIPFVDMSLNNQLSSRDRNQLKVINTGYSESVLTTYQQTSGTLSAGINVKINDAWNYYIKAGYKHPFNGNNEDVWQSSAGLNFNW